MTKNRLIALAGLALIFIAVFFITPERPAMASPSLQMTPGVNPMSMPTINAPTAVPGSGYSDPGLMSGQANCPMMSGSMTGMNSSASMGTMSGMTGMTGMSGMGNMSGTGSMSQMGSMSMNGMANVNDMLTNTTGSNWLLSINPWWLLGWLVLFGLIISLFVVGILLLVRQIRKVKSPAAG